MRLLQRYGLVFLALAFMARGFAQNHPGKPLKVAVFAPLYLDSVFAGDTYKPGKNNPPRYVLPGLDFYNGVMMAIDSLNAEKMQVEVLVYDTKRSDTTLAMITQLPEMQDVSLLIASFNTRTEIKTLADFALARKVPLVSATYPNDGDITANPYFVLINSTLPTHIESIYRFAHKTYPTDNIIWFKRKGSTEDLLHTVFTDLNKKTPGIPLKLKTVELPDSFTVNQVLANLDSNKQNVLVCGTLNEAFSINLTKAVGSNKSYKAVAIGMPTWDGIRDISKDIEVVYTSPYNLTRTDKPGIRFAENYRLKYAGRASDMALKGFESMYHFTRLLLKYNTELINHLSEKSFKIFNDFDIQPARSDKASAVPDYLENKKLYFIRKTDGRLKSVN